MQQDVCQHWAKFVAQSLQNRPIFKDECSKCFLTPKDEHGLNVCLTCLQGNCSNPLENHSELHYQNTYSGENDQHPIYLNIKMVRKVLLPGEKPKEITKLAIGKPGGMDAEADKWDHHGQVFCIPCKRELSIENPTVQQMAHSISTSQSAFNESSVQEWELELVACHHTKNLDQSTAVKIADKSLAHCGECELKTSLWLCMTCGHLGCSRKNYDGSGGNGHAVAHAQAAHHPVVCKLGTITPQGSASIHCYDCDDEVLDEKLKEHMGKLGIDISGLTKTEKTTTELNLEANLSLTLSKVLEEGKILVPVFGAGNTGLENLGNTCYMNSVVQVIMSMPEFKQRYYPDANQHLKECRKWTPDCYQCQMSKLAIGLYSGAYSKMKKAEKTDDKEDQSQDMYQDGIRPQMLKTLFGKGHKEFQTGQQQDAREYFTHFIDRLMKAEKSVKGRNDPTKAFQFEIESRLQCSSCDKFSRNRSTESELILTAPVASNVEAGTAVDLEACLQRFFDGQQIEDVFCLDCCVKRTHFERKRFRTYPKHLVVVLQRFVLDGWVPKKLEISLTQNPDEILDLERFRETHVPLTYVQAQQAQDEDVEPEIDINVLNQLLQIGIPETQAKHAVYNTGNQDAELACMWFYENIDNPAIQVPLKIKKVKTSTSLIQKPKADPEHVVMIESMGFTAKQAERALRKTDFNLERACDYIFSHDMNEPDSDDQMQVDQDSQNEGAVVQKNLFECERPEAGKYKLSSFITHLGTSVHAGHYVCHIRKEEGWVYYNDAKVAQCPEPPFGKGFVYVYSKQL